MRLKFPLGNNTRNPNLVPKFNTVMSNLIQIKAFGMVAEKIGKGIIEIENPGSTEDLKKKLFAQFPALKSMKFSLAVNKKIVSEDSVLASGAEVALLPPFSGG